MLIEQLKEFIVFARYLNFSKAARQLNIAQPTLSGHIAAMEKELGFTLVERSQPIRLTPAGQRFHNDALHLVEDYEKSVARCKGIAREGGGTLVLEQHHIRNGFERYIAKLVLEFRAAYPEVTVQWTNCQGAEIGSHVLNRQADGASLPNSNLVERDCMLAGKVDVIMLPDGEYHKHYLWVHRNNPLASRESISIHDVEGHPFLLPTSIEYSFLERQWQLAKDLYGVNITCKYWPGDYDECITHIGEEDVMSVSEEEIAQPAYTIVPDRLFIPFVGGEGLLKPCLIFLPENKNPALSSFKEFLETR